MVDRQIRRRGIEDPRIIEAFETVPRHEFVPERQARAGYDDRPLPIGGRQTISQPYIVAHMLDLAGIEAHHSVLDVGGGSGYAAAVTSRIAQDVISVEIRPELAASARETLERLGYDNVTTVAGTADDLPDGQTFDAILVAAAPSEIPQSLERRLADGARMVIPVGTRRGAQYLWIVERHGGTFVRSRQEPVAFVPLV